MLELLSFLVISVKSNEYYFHLYSWRNVRELVQLEIIRFRAGLIPALFF